MSHFDQTALRCMLHAIDDGQESLAGCLSVYLARMGDWGMKCAEG
jgi:hypothetical protein